MGQDDDEASDVDEPGREKPGEGFKRKEKASKKQKTDHSSNDKAEKSVAEEDDAQDQSRAAEKRKEREQRKKEKAARRQEKTEAKKARKQEAEAVEEQPVPIVTEHGDKEEQPHPTSHHSDMGTIDLSGLEAEDEAGAHSSASPSPARESSLSAESIQPSTSSVSSIVPTPAPDHLTTPKPDKIELPKVDKDALKARIEAKIAAMRAARHADGPDGKPARNRQELLEARRKKEEQRKVHKKELRKQAKDDEMKSKAEAELARLRGSGSPLTTPDVFSPRSPPDTNNFSFGRVSFNDGQSMDPSLTNLVDRKKRKGPSDPLTALAAAQKNHARVSGLDPPKRADIEEKDAWLSAKKKAHGERPRDDLSLLKKTLKRKQKAKMKSEKEWGERLDGVKKGKEARQRKREENLQKRKEEKGGKGKSKGVKSKKKGRPGFEGSFRGK